MQNPYVGVRAQGVRQVALVFVGAAGLLLGGSTAVQAQHGCCKARPLTTSPSSMMAPSWLMQMQSQMAQAQLMQSQMAQAQAVQQQMALRAGGGNPGAVPQVQPVAAQNPRVPARNRPVANKLKPEAADARGKVREANPVNPEAEANRLGADLVFADVDHKERVLERLKEGKGAAYTQALADAIAKLEGETKNKARDALAERLTRMKAGTLRDQLQDEDPEVRRAAALACAMKDDKSFVPDLIALLERDPAAPVVPALRASLISLTEQDFGPAPRSSREERARAVTAWKKWYKTQINER